MNQIFLFLQKRKQKKMYITCTRYIPFTLCGATLPIFYFEGMCRRCIYSCIYSMAWQKSECVTIDMCQVWIGKSRHMELKVR